MRAVIEKGAARGSVFAPPSKSMAHRLLIAAAYAGGVSHIKGVSHCEDVLATIDCLTALGARFIIDGDTVTVYGTDFTSNEAECALPCRESGSTLRFLIPTALLSDKRTVFTGAKRLIDRPHGVYEDLCREKGFFFENDGEKITVSGRLTAGDYNIPADVSSQFITGMLYALSALPAPSRIHLTTKIESKPYIDMTISALSAFGARCCFEDEKTIFISGGGYKSASVTVEGDYSGSAFTEALSLFGGEICVRGLSEDSLQGDRVYRKHYEDLSNGYAEINIESCPDLGPILFTVAAAKHGGRFTGTKRLKIKESDRATAMAEELSKFGADVRVYENEVVISPAELHRPTEILRGHNDHRVVMSLAVLCTLYGGEIDGFEAIKKSYPEFGKDLELLGIKVKYYEA